MNINIREKLENLSEKFSTDVDVVSLKALYNVPEDSRIIAAREEIIRRLLEKYPDDEEILEMFSVEQMPLDELIEILVYEYPDNVDVITINALYSQPQSSANINAINQCLERLLEQHIEEEYIELYFDKTRKELAKRMISKDKNSNVIFVKGGSFVPSFFNEKRKTFDIFVSKYDVTNEEWDELMDSNPSKVLGPRKPVNNVDRISAFEFCNKMSEKYGLKPVYKIENNKLVKIIYKDGKEVYPNVADFSKTEGYRLPTEVEWEWFAWGGKKAQAMGTFDKRLYKPDPMLLKFPVETSYNDTVNKFLNLAHNFCRVTAKPDDYSKFAWYGECGIHDVGLKRPNELGIYDFIGNVSQHVYDTASDGYLDEKRLHVYDENFAGRLRGGNCDCKIGVTVLGGNLYETFGVAEINSQPLIEKCGFRVVRTAD